MIKKNMKSKKSIKKIKIYVEGETEENYFDEFRKHNEGYDICIKPIMKVSGNYKTIEKKLRKEADIGLLAAFIIVDLDRYLSNTEQKNFLSLIEYIKLRNKTSGYPFILIGSNPDFEYFIAQHCECFKDGQEHKKFLLKQNKKYKDIRDIKADKNIYHEFNNLEKKRAFDVCKGRVGYSDYEKQVIHTVLTIKKKKMDIYIKSKDTRINSNTSCKGSNIKDLFDLLEGNIRNDK